MPTPPEPGERLLRYFDLDHLPPELREASRPCRQLALSVLRDVPPGPERTYGLRMLLIAKDCFVRAALDGGQTGA